MRRKWCCETISATETKRARVPAIRAERTQKLARNVYDKCWCAMCLIWRCSVAAYGGPNIESWTTYHQMSVTMPMDFIGDVDRATAVFGDSKLTLLGRLEIPDGVVEFWVLVELLGCHGRHGG